MVWLASSREVQECDKIFVREQAKSCPQAGFFKKHLAPMQDAMKKQLAPGQVVVLFHAFWFLLRPFLHRYTTVGIGMGCSYRSVKFSNISIYLAVILYTYLHV
jgi:hypothetical protein